MPTAYPCPHLPSSRKYSPSRRRHPMVPGRPDWSPDKQYQAELTTKLYVPEASAYRTTLHDRLTVEHEAGRPTGREWVSGYDVRDVCGALPVLLRCRVCPASPLVALLPNGETWQATGLRVDRPDRAL